jgi:biopolymer transport protein ExbD
MPPPGSDAKQPKKPPFELRLTIRPKMLVLSDNQGGLIKRIPQKNKAHNYALLKQTLKQIKARFPGKTALTILAEQSTHYDDLIQVMDASRSYQTLYEGEQVYAELFPNISIGDAAKQ